MSPKRLRLDAELVRRGEARSREQAAALIAAGRVTLGGQVATKSASGVSTDSDIVVRPDETDPGYASRGAYKLVGALHRFGAAGLSVSGRRCLDAGASTGGFTDVLLREGAREVVAVDVGYGQLIWRLRNDPRVQVLDRTNVRTLSLEDLDTPVDLVVGDLSFISLRLVLPALSRVAAPDADLALMVKPQFEVGKERLGKGGVVRDPQLRADAVAGVAQAAVEIGWGVLDVAVSPLPGPSGNIEFFLWLRRGRPSLGEADIRAAVTRAGESGDPGEMVKP